MLAPPRQDHRARHCAAAPPRVVKPAAGLIMGGAGGVGTQRGARSAIDKGFYNSREIGSANRDRESIERRRRGD